MSQENLRLFGIVKNKKCSYLIPSSQHIKSFYISVPLISASLIVNDNLVFTSKFIGLSDIDDNLYKIIFFDENLTLPLGKLNCPISISIDVGDEYKNAVILYEIE